MEGLLESEDEGGWEGGASASLTCHLAILPPGPASALRGSWLVPRGKDWMACPSCGGRMTPRQGQPFPTWPMERVLCGGGDRGVRLGEEGRRGGVELGVAWAPPPVWN